MSSLNIGFPLDQYPTLKRASMSSALIRLVKGSAGSGKTSWAIMELLRSALLQTPSPLDNTRYFRALVVRNTYALLKSNTIPSMKNMFGPLLQVTEGSQPFGRVRARLQDGTALDMEIQFLALDSEDAQDKLLGAEPTMVLCDELNLMPESVVFALVRRLGRYPSGTKGKVDRTGVIGVFNGPVKGSWLHKWYLGERDAQFEKVAREMGVEKLVEMFSQPPALIPPAGFPNSHDPNDEWLPNPEAENIQNLAQGYGYYYAMLADPDMGKIQSYVLGEFADVKHGKVVFPEFHRDVHTFPAERVNTKELRDYYLAFDFGRTPVCIVGTLLSDGTLMVLDEFMGEDMSVEQLYRATVRPALKRNYPNGVCVRAYGDPAGLTGGQNINLSPFDVLRKEGVPIVAPTRSNKLEPRLAAVRSFMSSLGTGGKPRLLIRDHGRFPLQALAADYIYENRSGGRTADTPTKSHVGWVSDLCLAADTMIATPNGSVPIQHIRVGDEVLTRNGVRKVLAAAMTNPSAEVFEYDIGGIKLTATPNHPVFANGAFHAIDRLVGNTVYCNVSNQAETVKCEATTQLKMYNSLMDYGSHGTQATSITGGKSVTIKCRHTEKERLYQHTGMYGNAPTAQSLTATKYTTRTTTRATMPSTTWNWSKPSNTLHIMPRNGWRRTQSSEPNSTRPVLKLQKNGINLKRGELGTRNTPSRLHRLKSHMVQSKYALGVVRPLLVSPPSERKDFVVCPVKAWRERPAGWMTCSESAKNAEQSSWQINTPRQGSATQNVPVFIQRGNASRERVYNLTVETDNEYYANGVLVHNCDSLQYIAMGLLLVMSTGDDDATQYETEIEWC